MEEHKQPNIIFIMSDDHAAHAMSGCSLDKSQTILKRLFAGNMLTVFFILYYGTDRLNRSTMRIH
jgi:hypothetical protein